MLDRYMYNLRVWCIHYTGRIYSKILHNFKDDHDMASQLRSSFQCNNTHT